MQLSFLDLSHKKKVLINCNISLLFVLSIKPSIKSRDVVDTFNYNICIFKK